MSNADPPLQHAIQLLIAALAILGLTTLVLVTIKAWLRPPLLAYEPRRPVPWRASDLLLVVLFVFLVMYIGGQVAVRIQSGPAAPSGRLDSAIGFNVVSLAELVGVGLGIFLLRMQAGADWLDLGFATWRLPRDLGIGAIALLASAVPVYGLQEWLQKLVPYTHDILKSLHAHPGAPMLIATAFAALVAAPLFEEFIFRVLLQGWFESIESQRATRLGLSGDAAAWWPIVLSSFVWAAMHWGNGLAVIPLFFFGLVLGYLYRQTHRIWPSLMTHFLLNATSMFFVWYQIAHGGI